MAGDTDLPFPLDRLCGELDLRAKRLLVLGLQARLHWLAPRRLRAERKRRRIQGQQLARELILPMVGGEQFTWLDLRPADGAGPGFRLSSVLSFGYDLGTSLAALLCCPASSAELSGRLCALFNVGITLFDRVCDDTEEGAALARDLIEEEGLRRLIREAGTADFPHGAALPYGAGAENHGRLLQALATAVGGFFLSLHDSAVPPAESPEWRDLEAALIASYHAELSTAGRGLAADSPCDLMAAAATKSVAPFTVMGCVARICFPVSGDEISELQAAAHHLGRVFSLVDDIVDLVSDLRAGQVNTLLLRVVIDRGDRGCRDMSAGAIAVELLDSDVIGDAVGELCDEMDTLTAYSRSYARPDLYSTALSHAQMWVSGSLRGRG